MFYRPGICMRDAPHTWNLGKKANWLLISQPVGLYAFPNLPFLIHRDSNVISRREVLFRLELDLKWGQRCSQIAYRDFLLVSHGFHTSIFHNFCSKIILLFLFPSSFYLEL